MTEEEQKQFAALQEQRDSARKNAEEMRAQFNGTLSKYNGEIQFYRRVCWSLVAAAALAVILNLLQK